MPSALVLAAAGLRTREQPEDDRFLWEVDPPSPHGLEVPPSDVRDGAVWGKLFTFFSHFRSGSRTRDRRR